MLNELYALLHRYYTVYLRLPKRLLSDFLLAAIIAGALALCRLQDIGYLAVVVYVITLPFTFITTVRTMLGEIVSEKGSGIKEYLKLNGLSIYVYQLYLAIITSVKTAFCTAFIIVGILLGALIASLQSNPLFDLNISTGDTILTYILCAFGTISFILFLSTFFSDAKVAASVGSLVYAAISLCSNIVFASTNSTYYYLICLFPQSALTITLFSGLIGDDSYVPGFTYSGARLIMVFDIFIYLILYVYLDQVLKDENGVQRSPLFFLDFLRAKKSRGVAVRQTFNDSGAHLLNNQPESAAIDIPGAVDGSSAVYHEALVGAQNLRKAVEVQNLVKNFGSFTAVDNVSFPIYEGQIFCLLGHNGAGKTTTIRMMTGLVEIDKGHILYNGADFVENMKEIRRTIGICTQQDILYEKLKVCEHLELIAKLRKIPEGDIPAAVDEAIARLNLTNERDKFSEELSGGNKRKLSLAMAVLGRTKIIFLDEPTSGMDPQNRRVMWQHLKELRKQGLTILLTTHHLDEADELADRIAIMSKGKLLALGTSEFFKKNFGVGYHLNLTPKYELINSADFQALKPKLGKVVHDIVPIAEFDNQTAPDVLKCCLPFTAQKEFPRLFAELETNDAVRISVEMNTLEDVFVNIGLKEEQLLNPNAGRGDLNLNIQPPACLSEKPVYSFTSQVYALAKRRFYILSRSGRNIFLMVLPAILILIGVLSSLGFNDAESRIGFFEVVTVLAFALNTGAYCSLPVYEREEKLKYLMDVMGLRVLPYWLGNVIVDWIAITIINLIAFALYCWLYSGINTEYIFDNLIFVTPGQFLAVIIPHGFALVTIGYAYSFLFDRALSAVKYFPLLYFFILFLLGTFAVAKLQNNGKAGDFVLFFAAVVGIICPSSIFLEFLGGNQMMTGLTVGETVITELFYALVYFGITVFLSSRSLRFKQGTARQGYVSQENQPIPIDFNDINFERNRTAQAAQDPIKVMGLTKVYDNGYTAVRETSFGVEPGQIFGLLGPNGAGKSTTFNILTAAIPKSEGSVKLLNHEVDRNMPEVFENVGICPQFNGLWDHLTVREHLILFGNLKGLSGPKLNEVTEYYLDALHLRDHENKRAHALSGGNKRKLSVANAFIGSAYLLFLDEPSSGVDPLARRFLWNSIQQVLKMRQASVVLTTHSMYEAESLSHKIGILINGRFVCVGPTQYLKDKYSQGYKITVSLLPDCPDPMPKVQELFPNAIRVFDASYVQQTYHLPSQDFKFSSAFEKLDVLKHEGAIKDFSIYNTTLEQIFIYFSRFQINVENNQ